MPFSSILFIDSADLDAAADAPEPAFFHDLNLDRLIESVTRGREQYNLKPLFYARLTSLAAIAYRHDVLRDLGQQELVDNLRVFAKAMQSMRDNLGRAQKLHYRRQKERWRLDAVGTYCRGVAGLLQALNEAMLESRGFLDLRDYLTHYTSSSGFTSMFEDTQGVQDGVSRIAYCLHIKGNRIKVSRYDGEPDYSRDVQDTFRRFRQRPTRSSRASFSTSDSMDHVEAGILDIVARLYPETFSALDRHCERYPRFADDTIIRFDREIQFYLAYLEFVARASSTGLLFCYPKVSADDKKVRACETFDIALADKLSSEPVSVVTNDFSLEGPERILVVSGPNQGGKTTLARTFGQLHYLASIGCLVPGREARLLLCDELFTHFEREENLGDLTGKLQDELVRTHDILERATSSSVIIINEIFTSATLRDALVLGTEVIERLIRLDALCVCVTFVDELASLGPATVSVVSTVDPADPAVRTYKLVRKPADGLAYAAAIAEKYGLTYERLKDRVRS